MNTPFNVQATGQRMFQTTTRILRAPKFSTISNFLPKEYANLAAYRSPEVVESFLDDPYPNVFGLSNILKLEEVTNAYVGELLTVFVVLRFLGSRPVQDVTFKSDIKIGMTKTPLIEPTRPKTLQPGQLIAVSAQLPVADHPSVDIASLVTYSFNRQQMREFPVPVTLKVARAFSVVHRVERVSDREALLDVVYRTGPDHAFAMYPPQVQPAHTGIGIEGISADAEDEPLTEATGPQHQFPAFVDRPRLCAALARLDDACHIPNGLDPLAGMQRLREGNTEHHNLFRIRTPLVHAPPVLARVSVDWEERFGFRAREHAGLRTQTFQVESRTLQAASDAQTMHTTVDGPAEATLYRPFLVTVTFSGVHKEDMTFVPNKSAKLPVAGPLPGPLGVVPGIPARVEFALFPRARGLLAFDAGHFAGTHTPQVDVRFSVFIKNA
eukprot:gnl/Chilomastix_cuspidata/1450.p1 GENE.gnl/Chilomastix_cuspidata/1450~~gnl/Chilomastix_cuspidata/1450.p1  ORF type:complete len:451 (-),score=172.79 gnl/Chilomastix_cuspidata/1450:867-2183(-)